MGEDRAIHCSRRSTALVPLRKSSLSFQRVAWEGAMSAGRQAKEQVPLLEDSNARIRGAALEVLQTLGQDALSEHIDKIAVLLQDSVGSVRVACMETLSSCVLGMSQPEERDAMIDRMASLVNDENTAVRWSTLVALQRLGDRASSHADTVAQCLTDPDAGVRWAALVALQKLGGTITTGAAAHVATITKMLKDVDPDVRRTALVTLDKLGEPTAAHAAQVLSKDLDVNVRKTALAICGKLTCRRLSPSPVRRRPDESLELGHLIDMSPSPIKRRPDELLTQSVACVMSPSPVQRRPDGSDTE